MDAHLGAEEFGKVRALLAERLSPWRGDPIAAAAFLAYSDMTRRVQDYVPVVVEHTGAEGLGALAASEERAVASTSRHEGVAAGLSVSWFL